MRTSTKLLLLALIILLGTTAAYDLALQKVYKKGRHNDSMWGFKKLDYKNFKEVEINVANGLNIDIIYCDTFAIGVNNNIQDEVKIKQIDSKLIITFDTKQQGYYSYVRSLVIKCPVIKSLTTNSLSFAGSLAYQGEGVVSLQGFDQDKFFLTMGWVSNVNLKNNKFDYLSAELADQSKLLMDKSNQINTADLNVKNRSTLTLADIATDHFKLKISDSASLKLSGVSLKLIKDQ